ncbi:DPP IV N-terminal domain-containing protein [uncultured Paludibaculum sp.]|uniref:S9 family peptidase n=1 Tax=uncultured Paludibaculum sp. TaxID=1765020 RepID=UPI002AAB6E0B|nr:DPP IV N-terminal domain-containing protein [uncultured Paludibaculum sp.]
MHWKATAALLALSTQLTPAQQKKPVTLESLSSGMTRMMAQFGSTPIWAPDGRRFAVRRGDEVALFDIASQTEKELFSTSELSKLSVQPPASKQIDWENRRVSESRLQWSSDGHRILLIGEGDLFLWSDETGKIEQLTATEVQERDPKLSPDGAKVSFRRGHELYVMDIASRKVTQLTTDSSETRWNAALDWVYPEELDLGTAHWWSPDSKSIAYLQFDVSREPLYPHADHLKIEAVAEPQRYPKAGAPNADVRVGVVEASGGLTRWMDFGETRDYLLARAHWTPDSNRVVVHRLNRTQNHLWILAADARTGKAQSLIEESDPAWINLSDDFEFLADGRIVLSSEKDGFRHIYLYSAEGRHEKQLTHGDWEVTAVSCVDEKSKKIWYTSSETSPLERQLYVVDFNGKDKRQLTKGAGTHSISMGPGCQYYLDTYSNLENPSRAMLNRAEDGSEVKVWREADRRSEEEYDILKSEIHTFKGTDGTLFYGRMIKPAGFDPAKKYPVLISVYGGPHVQTVRNSYSGLSWEQVMAHKGFLIWQMDNRGSYGRGHKFESPINRRLGKQELEDQKEGVKYLSGLGFADPNRVGIYGWSYGGYMTLYALVNAPEVFKAGAAGAAVADWRNYDTIYTERYLGRPQENEDGYKASSPVHSAAKLQGKLLLMHNIEDDNVLFGNALQMMNALQLENKDFETVIYSGKSHGVMGKARQHMLEKQTKFFEESLK